MYNIRVTPIANHIDGSSFHDSGLNTAMSKLKTTVVKVIDKLLRVKRRVSLENNHNTRNILISYVVVPTNFLSFYFKSTHNNTYQSYLLIKMFYERGYNVYLHYYLDEKAVDYSKEYDIYIGHNVSFANIARKLKGNPRKFLLATGSEPNFGNRQQRLRVEDLNRRRKTDMKVYSDNIVPDLTENYELADLIVLMGNDFVRKTYPVRFAEKMALVNNVTLHPFFEPVKRARNNHFLFISSVGQVHRGLDLLLEIFSKLPYKLYVLSAFKSEPEFERIYANELYHSPNIIPVGFVSLDSADFRSAVNDSDFVILPSCSEGQSSSVVNLMAYGLLPVVPKFVGIDHIAELGVDIEELTIESVTHAVRTAVAMSDEEYHERKQRVLAEIAQYSAQNFAETMLQLTGLVNEKH
jgi:hypothetical protein